MERGTRGLSKTWIIDIEKNITLTFGGDNHKTLKIVALKGYKILSIYGEK